MLNMISVDRMKQVRVAIVIAKECEDIEVIVPYDLWKRAKIFVETISIDKKNTVVLAHGTSIKCCGIISKTNLNQFNAIYLPGGPGYEHLANNAKLRENLIKFSEDPKKYLLAMCASPVIFKKLDLYKENKFTCYPTILGSTAERKKISNYVDKPCVISNQFLTGKAPGSIFAFAFAALDLFVGKKISNQIKSDIFYCDKPKV